MSDSFATTFWAAVDRLLALDRPPSDLAGHGIGPLVARRLRALGRDVPPALADEELQAVTAALAAPVLLRRIRDAWDGPLVVMKGPEVAARYPREGLRAFGDVDVLVPDAASAQRALEAAGFKRVGDPGRYVGIHHLRPLAVPELPLAVEVHSAPKWPDGLPVPRVEELLEAAIPAAVGVAGVQALRPDHHVLVLAAHGWAHEPLRRLGDIFDVAVELDGCAPEEVAALAERWGLARLWSSTGLVLDAVLEGTRLPQPLRLWARSLEDARERTVLDNHLQRLLSGFAVLPPGPASRAFARACLRELLPEDESWSTKLRRTFRAARNRSRPRSEHERMPA